MSQLKKNKIILTNYYVIVINEILNKEVFIIYFIIVM